MHQNQKILVAVDGSEASKEAFFQALEFKHHDDFLYVVHISDPTKNLYLHYNYQPHRIYQDYEQECLSRFLFTQFSLVFQDRKNENNTIQSQILDLAKELGATRIIIGYHGRKGKKLDITLMGKTVQETIINSHIPLIIVKELYQRNKKQNFKFLVCFDGSIKSSKALQLACNTSFSGDEIHAVYCPSKLGEINVKTIEQLYEDVRLNLGNENVSKKLILTEESDDPITQLIKYLNNNEEHNFDFICVGNNGSTAQLLTQNQQIEPEELELQLKSVQPNNLGRMARQVIGNAKANILLAL